MRNLYVGELFPLLHNLGIIQQDVADHLQVGRVAVAAWAGGQRAVPKRHAATFLAFVEMAIAAAEAQAPGPDDARGSLLHDPRSRIVSQMLRQLRRWQEELYASSGRLERDYERCRRALQGLLHLPPGHLGPAGAAQARPP